MGLANPVKLAVSTGDLVKTSTRLVSESGVASRGLTKELAADRRVSSVPLTDDERCLHLAAAVRVAANAGFTVVVVVDDGHYADPSLVSFLRQLTQIEIGSVLVVVSAWPSLVRQRSDGMPGRSALS